MIFVTQGDIYPVTFTANADLTGATVRLLATLDGTSTPVELVSTFTVNAGQTVITHVLDGTLAVGLWRVEAKASLAGRVMTFPTGTAQNPAFEQMMITADFG